MNLCIFIWSVISNYSYNHIYVDIEGDYFLVNQKSVEKRIFSPGQMSPKTNTEIVFKLEYVEFLNVTISIFLILTRTNTK